MKEPIKAFLGGFYEGWMLAYTIPFASILMLIERCKNMKDMDNVAIIVSTIFYVLLFFAVYGIGCAMG